MNEFMIRFLTGSIFICGIIGILLAAKRLFRKSLSNRMQYNLWFLLLGLLAVPFIPLSPLQLPQIFSWITGLIRTAAANRETPGMKTATANAAHTADWIYDFAISVNSTTPSAIGYILFGVWITGMLVMILWLLKSSLHLRALKSSALPLQDFKTRRLYQRCLKEVHIKKRNSHLQYCISKIPCYHGMDKTMYLSSDPSDFRLQ